MLKISVVLAMGTAVAVATLPALAYPKGSIRNACEIGDVAAVKKALAKNPRCIRETDPCSDYPQLRIAAECGHLELVKFLVSKGGKDEDALAHAAKGGNLEIVQFLVGKGFPLNPQKGVLPLGEAKTVEIAQFLMSKGAKVNPLNPNPPLEGQIFEFTNNDPDMRRFDIIKLLLDKGAVVNTKGSEKSALNRLFWPPGGLGLIFDQAVLEIAEMLVKHGGKFDKNALSRARGFSDIFPLVQNLAEGKPLPPKSERGLPVVNSGELLLSGKCYEVIGGKTSMVISAAHFQLPNGRWGEVKPDVRKSIRITDQTLIHRFAKPEIKARAADFQGKSIVAVVPEKSAGKSADGLDEYEAREIAVFIP